MDLGFIHMENQLMIVLILTEDTKKAKAANLDILFKTSK
ncbi:hypothetical protein CRYPA_1986 [uncultured Candidatus Thioglobus sp.]|nr:hypothetical protein CRYPA_1986 [uncultured Candidatus Thioglobus sp.]